ncbi:sucrose-specific PTS transporter subunit IIBC [Sporolactobacillus laevolacticus]|uniref:sucrose-specific PTS transporter subunit IIBC n=1 Tax=Sporolactobacillus laevolacticus TaxID=33018 RepID=UPI0025B42A85|nr:sucrose-specific PTS transporter subunit IIBC [Sporolactobacillus laevolacticus]MDN3955050.1 sucrose-specific PTS transporter subunit IIBC [Sporolactobacillus laevolacticus]
MNYVKVAQDVLTALSGKENIQAAAHCATRLRLVIKDESKINQTALDEHPDVKGTFKTNGQFQIIIGPGDVDKVYDELIKLAGLPDMTKEDVNHSSSGPKGNIFMQFIKVLSDIFVPIIPALVAGGLLMALNNVLTAEHLFTAKSIVEIYPGLKDIAGFINTMSAAPFFFLPVLIGFSATKRFGGNPYLGAAMGMIMVSPALTSGYEVVSAAASGKLAYWNIFGLHVAQAGYQGSVLPVLVVSFILAKLEIFFHKRISKAFDFTFTPMLAIIITGFLTFIFVGPVMRNVSDGLTNGIMWLYNTTGPIGTMVFGFFYSAIVITGLHQSFPAIETQLLANRAITGGSFVFPIASMANIAQGAACLAVFFITKNKKQKSLASSSSISALLGITEPAIFGVNLKLKYPFVCAMIASGIASIFVGLFHVLAVSIGPASVIGFICIRSQSISTFLLSGLISFVLAFTITYIYGKRAMAAEVAAADSDLQVSTEEDIESVAEGTQLLDEIVYAPVSGDPISLKEVNDKVFSSEFMGRGAAIIPENGDVYAPCDGLVTVAYPTHHAYGIKTDGGAEVLIHIGIDTVNLNGEHFESFVKKDQQVRKGDKLCHFDLDKIKALGYDPAVITVITNTAEYASVERITHEHVASESPLIALTAK